MSEETNVSQTTTTENHANRVTRFFIDEIELEESEFEEWLRDCESNAAVYAMSIKNGSPYLYKYIRSAGGMWHAFSGLDDPYLLTYQFISFIRTLQNLGTVVSNKRIEWDHLPPRSERQSSNKLSPDAQERVEPQTSSSSPQFVPAPPGNRSWAIGCLAVAIVFAAIVALIVGLANAGNSSTSGSGDKSSNSQVVEARTEQEITSDLCSESDKPLATLFETIYADTITSSSWEEFGSDISRGQETSSLLPFSNDVKSGYDLILEWSALPVQTAMDSVDSSGIEQFVIGCLTNGSELTEVQSVMDAN